MANASSIKFGYNDNAYNKFMALTNQRTKKVSIFVLNNHFTAYLNALGYGKVTATTNKCTDGPVM